MVAIVKLMANGLFLQNVHIVMPKKKKVMQCEMHESHIKYACHTCTITWESFYQSHFYSPKALFSFESSQLDITVILVVLKSAFKIHSVFNIILIIQCIKVDEAIHLHVIPSKRSHLIWYCKTFSEIYYCTFFYIMCFNCFCKRHSCATSVFTKHVLFFSCIC
jgi:hypothetical protein